MIGLSRSARQLAPLGRSGGPESARDPNRRQKLYPGDPGAIRCDHRRTVQSVDRRHRQFYTREFYQIVKSKIKDDGIFAQWFHNYSMSPDDFRMVFRTFAEAFPYVSLWGMKESDFLLVGSKKEQVFDYPAVKADLRQQQDAAIGSRISRPFGRLCGARLLPHEPGRLFGFFEGRFDQYRRWRAARILRAQEPAPRDHRAEPQADDALFSVDSPPWLKGKPLPVPAGDAPLLYGAVLSWRAWRAARADKGNR